MDIDSTGLHISSWPLNPADDLQIDAVDYHTFPEPAVISEVDVIGLDYFQDGTCCVSAHLRFGFSNEEDYSIVSIEI